MDLTGVKIISSDDHLQEPADLWARRMPKNLRDRAPQVVRLPDGGDAWVMDNNPPRAFGVLVSAGRRPDQLKDGGLTWADVPRGSYDPDERLKAMDLDGISVTVLYPNVTLDPFMCLVKLGPDVEQPILRAYNDHLAEFCSTDRKRLIGIGVVPTQDIAQAVAELQHIAKLGLKGALIPVAPPKADWNDPMYEPIWTAAEDLGLVLSIHGGKPRGLPTRNELAKQPGGNLVYMHIARVSIMEAFAYLFWSGVFERHPKLKFVSVEGDIGWLPYYKQRSIDISKKHGAWAGAKLQYPAAHWFGKSFFATFEDDRVGIEQRERIGIDTLLWASDFPHSSTTWPESAKAIGHTFAGVPDDEVRKIVSSNARALYRLD